MLYNVDSLDVSIVAVLLGCKPDNGLVNRMNDLRARRLIVDGDTYGDMLRAVITDIATYFDNIHAGE